MTSILVSMATSRGVEFTLFDIFRTIANTAVKDFVSDAFQRVLIDIMEITTRFSAFRILKFCELLFCTKKKAFFEYSLSYSLEKYWKIAYI